MSDVEKKREYPEELELTGAFVRAQREGKFYTLDFTDLTPEERVEFFLRTNNGTAPWIEMLVGKLREMATQFGISRGPLPAPGEVTP